MSDAASIAFQGTITLVRRSPLAEFVRPSTARAVRSRSPGKSQSARFTSTVSTTESTNDATSHCITARLAQSPDAATDTPLRHRPGTRVLDKRPAPEHARLRVPIVGYGARGKGPANGAVAAPGLGVGFGSRGSRSPDGPVSGPELRRNRSGPMPSNVPPAALTKPEAKSFNRCASGALVPLRSMSTTGFSLNASPTA